VRSLRAAREGEDKVTATAVKKHVLVRAYAYAKARKAALNPAVADGIAFAKMRRYENAERALLEACWKLEEE
jgi:hypothetical protein